MISLRDCNEALNLIGKPNVHVDYDELKLPREGGPLYTNLNLYHTLIDIVNNRPNWRFVVCAVVDRASNVRRIVHGFDIYEGDDHLGSVQITYHGKEYKIAVSAERISKARKRGRGDYHTTDPARAALKIRKNLFADSPAERVAKVTDLTAAIAERNRMVFSNDSERAANRYFSNARQFVSKNREAYVAMFPAAGPLFENYKEAAARMETSVAFQTCFNSDQCVTVIERDGVYTTKSSSGLKQYTSDTLPYEYKRKIGLLKLVEPEQIISDVGCRIEQDAFVLMPSREGEQNEN